VEGEPLPEPEPVAPDPVVPDELPPEAPELVLEPTEPLPVTPAVRSRTILDAESQQREPVALGGVLGELLGGVCANANVPLTTSAPAERRIVLYMGFLRVSHIGTCRPKNNSLIGRSFPTEVELREFPEVDHRTALVRESSHKPAENPDEVQIPRQVDPGTLVLATASSTTRVL
jgi:hypothetical protein